MKWNRYALASICAATACMILILVVGTWKYASLTRAIQQIQNAGGSVTLGTSYFLPRVESVHLYEVANANELLKSIGQFQHLKTLSLQSSHFSDDSLKHLAHLQQLEELDLKWTSVSDAGLAHLRGLPRLKEVKLIKLYPPSRTNYSAPEQLTDLAIEHLSQISTLEKIIIWGANLSDDSLDSLSHCYELKVLWLLDAGISGDHIHKLTSLTQLERLDLSGNQITSEDIAALQDLPKLTMLSVARTEVSSTDAKAFLAQMPTGFSIGH